MNENGPTRDELQAAIDCALYLLRTWDAVVDDELRVKLAAGMLSTYATENRPA